MKRLLPVIFFLGWAWAQQGYVDTYSTVFEASSRGSLGFGVAAGVRQPGEGYGLAGRAGVRAASTFLRVTLGMQVYAFSPDSGLYGGAGLELDYRIFPALPAQWEATLGGFVGYELAVTPLWSWTVQAGPAYGLGSGVTSLEVLTGFRLYFGPGPRE